MCPQKLQVILIDLTCDLPTLILELIPGAMKDLHFLQKTILKSYGILILCLELMRLARWACCWESLGFFWAFEIALSIKICILSNAIFLIAGFTSFLFVSPKNCFLSEKMQSAGFEPASQGWKPRILTRLYYDCTKKETKLPT